jgi:hypothetical protein
MVPNVSMKRFLPAVIGAGLVALISILLLLWKSSDPTPASDSIKPLGTSTLSHGGPGPIRQDHLSTTEKSRVDITEQTTAR